MHHSLVMNVLPLTTTCILHLEILRLSLGFAGVCNHSCIVSHSHGISCHCAVISSKNSQPNIICIRQSKDVFTASAPISIEINTTILRGVAQMWERIIRFPFWNMSFFVCAGILSLFCKNNSIGVSLRAIWLTFFGGHLWCVFFLDSGFGLVWNTKNEVLCLFLFYSGRYEFPNLEHFSRHLHLN